MLLSAGTPKGGIIARVFLCLKEGEMKLAKITIKKKTDNFTVLDNTCLKDEKLSWKAKGLLVYMLHLPDDWQFYVADLKNRSTDGKDSTSSAIKELIEAGYIERTKAKNEKGQFTGYNYIVYEKPKSGATVAEIPSSVNPSSVNPSLLSTNNTKLLNKVNSKKDIDVGTKDKNIYPITNKRFIKPTIQQIQQYLDIKNIKDFTAEYFYNYYESKGWLVGKSKMKNWKAAIATWKSRSNPKQQEDIATKLYGEYLN